MVFTENERKGLFCVIWEDDRDNILLNQLIQSTDYFWKRRNRGVTVANSDSDPKTSYIKGIVDGMLVLLQALDEASAADKQGIDLGEWVKSR